MNIRSLIRHTVSISALCALLGAPTLAYSAAIYLVGDGYQNGSESFTVNSVTPPLVGAGVNAGGFFGRMGPNPGPNPPTTPILFWCAELTQTFNFGVVYSDYSISPLGNTILSQLFTMVGSATRASTPDFSAGFQLAIWEILFEGGTYGGFDVTSGNFNVTGDAGAIAQANIWLGALDALDPATAVLFALSSPGHQDFITDIPNPPFLTPEPGSLALLGIGILAAMFGTRRRTQRASL